MIDSISNILTEFRWGRIVLVYFNEGITRRVVDELLASGKVQIETGRLS